MDWKTFYQDNHEIIIGGTFTLIGVFIGWTLNLIQSHFQNKRDDEVYLKRKREETYIKVLDVLMRSDKCYREQYIEEKEYEEYKRLFNDLQSLMLVYASSKIYKEYYKLCAEICNTYEGIKKKNKREKLQYINAEKVENFASKIRKELGIEGDVSWQ